MLFRRIKAHIAKENWFAVFLDFVIVVVGILIAFQITNWNEARGDRAAEGKYLSALESDARQSLEHLEVILTNLQEQQNARKILYEYNKDPAAELAVDQIGELLQVGSCNIQRMKINRVSFNGAANAEQLSLIGEPRLITSLQTLEAVVEDAFLSQDESLKFAWDYTDPYLINETDMENLMVDTRAGQPIVLDWIKGQSQPVISIDKLKSMKFKNLVLLKAEISRSRMMTILRLVEQYETVLTLIDERQGNIGVG